MRFTDRYFHNHLLPGVDDGFNAVEDSLSAISRLSEIGCRDITFTPHINPDVYPENKESFIIDRYNCFVPLIPKELNVSVSLAAEYMVCEEFQQSVEKHPDSLLSFGDRFVLIEMSYYFKSPNLDKVVFALQLAGYRPVIAHPERYLYMSESLNEFDELYDRGCLFQLNYLSFTGAYGPQSVKIIKHLVKQGMADFISSDLHSLNQLDCILNAKPIFKLRGLYSQIVP